ncbi:uncharacterized protein CLUP02_02453 [Colletotrichum lupini]|uniref:Uncharacterized protein n=1 Tax=Colletotrichum lupini TaxID=145971 RepID=A0A9Q8WBS8_9PEZI|nr:uncharacterized protein CLUP02_02453 [Colletotrichum lupini]UQC76987.1 hypothetical protein CLUP02_02453 [Colletotrichum lupini]
MKAPKSGWATGNNGDLSCLHFLPDGATGPRVRASGEEWTSLQWTGQGHLLTCKDCHSPHSVPFLDREGASYERAFYLPSGPLDPSPSSCVLPSLLCYPPCPLARPFLALGLRVSQSGLLFSLFHSNAAPTFPPFSFSLSSDSNRSLSLAPNHQPVHQNQVPVQSFVVAPSLRSIFTVRKKKPLSVALELGLLIIAISRHGPPTPRLHDQPARPPSELRRTSRSLLTKRHPHHVESVAWPRLCPSLEYPFAITPVENFKRPSTET